MKISSALAVFLLLFPPVHAGHTAGHQDAVPNALSELLAAPVLDFLEVDQAFVLSLEPADARSVRARFAIAEGYYLYRLYRDKIRFTVASDATALGAYTLPPGERKRDDYFGEMEVYYGHMEVRLPLESRVTAPARLQLHASYQGCAERGICYPPVTKEFRVELGASGLLQVAPAQPPPSPPAPHRPAARP